MDFLLIAPLDGVISPEPRLNALSAGEMAMRSRIDYAARELVQTWTSLDSELTASTSGTSADLVVPSRAWLVSIRDRQLAVMAVSAKLTSSSAIEDVEAVLSSAAADFIARHPALARRTPLWVSRTALLREDTLPPKGWLEASAREVELAKSGVDGSGPAQRVFVGWGNNAIAGFALDGDPSQTPIVLGLLDAQYLWLDLEGLSATSSHVVHDVAETEKSTRSTGLNAKLRTIEALSNSLAIHNLEYDDLLMHIQGPRRAVGVTLLRVWNYDDVAARIARRLEDTARILEQNKARQDSRYQGLVEAILFGLGLAAVLELVLVAIGTAIAVRDSGVTTDSPLGIFRWLEATNPDLLVFGTIVAIVVTVVAVGITRFSRR